MGTAIIHASGGATQFVGLLTTWITVELILNRKTKNRIELQLPPPTIVHSLPRVPFKLKLVELAGAFMSSILVFVSQTLLQSALLFTTVSCSLILVEHDTQADNVGQSTGISHISPSTHISQKLPP
jgi:hypothetical protein